MRQVDFSCHPKDSLGVQDGKQSIEADVPPQSCVGSHGPQERVIGAIHGHRSRHIGAKSQTTAPSLCRHGGRERQSDQGVHPPDELYPAGLAAGLRF